MNDEVRMWICVTLGNGCALANSKSLTWLWMLLALVFFTRAIFWWVKGLFRG